MENRKQFCLILFVSVFSFIVFPCYAQSDSVQLQEVLVSSYLGDRPVLRLPASVALIDSAQIARQNPQSLVPVLNTVPGVRMEERSPGSYRLSIRGSLIRSPFGIRNTKIYLDEFPLTNAGGDAYLNLLDVNTISSIEVLKGPDGSLFGANSGGVLRISPFDKRDDSTHVRIGAGLGSYGLFQENVNVQLKQKQSVLSLNQSWQRSEGYRSNSAMERKMVQVGDRINYNAKGQLRLYFLFADLNYQTPGGLTLAQFNEDPKQARPATKVVPGAVEQQAGIRNRSFFGGLTHDYKITERLKHTISIFGVQTFFENPFITNYEVRDEQNAGARTWLELVSKEEAKIKWTWNIGGEFQQMHSIISNYGNNKGTKDTVQAIDNLDVSQGFVFTRYVLDLNNKWNAELSLSYNLNRFTFARTQPVSTQEYQKILNPELMPRLAASYLLNDFISFRGIISRGYSPPTLQEIRSSDNRVNTSLQAESGWNYEAGFRLMDRKGIIYWDLSGFYYELNQAIVKRVNDLGQDYFVNAGTTYQPGIESLLRLNLVRSRNQGFIRGLQLANAYTLNFFRFGTYITDVADYSGKALTGVPRYVSVSNVIVQFPLGFYFFAQHNYTAHIPLNDLNTEYASAYNLVQLKLGWRFAGKKRFVVDVSAGVDNLLDEKYSLGNDLNAVGNRYYNAAMPRNYFARIVIGF
jgi:iron complex outermembrane receptor protein